MKKAYPIYWAAMFVVMMGLTLGADVPVWALLLGCGGTATMNIGLLWLSEAATEWAMSTRKDPE